MSYACNPNTEEYPESGDVLKELVELNPSEYVLEDNGPCQCCDTCDYDFMHGLPDPLYATVSGSMCSDGTYEMVRHEAPVPPGWPPQWGDIGYAAYNIPIWSWLEGEPGSCGGVEVIVHTDLYLVCYGEDTLMLICDPAAGACPTSDNRIPYRRGEPFFAKWLTYQCEWQAGGIGEPDTTRDVSVCISADGTCPTDEELDEDRPWWCVEIPAHPFRECKQNVTEAVGGPYDTQLECTDDTDCLPCNFYCVEYQDHDSEENLVGSKYYDCVQLTGVVPGQVTHPFAGGSSNHRLRRILDGPFTESRCVCPPCPDISIPVSPTPVCNVSVSLSSTQLYVCLDGVCVPVLFGFPGDYTTSDCDGECV